jgi:hypothetical protein
MAEVTFQYYLLESFPSFLKKQTKPYAAVLSVFASLMRSLLILLLA